MHLRSHFRLNSYQSNCAHTSCRKPLQRYNPVEHVSLLSVLQMLHVDLVPGQLAYRWFPPRKGLISSVQPSGLDDLDYQEVLEYRCLLVLLVQRLSSLWRVHLLRKPPFVDADVQCRGAFVWRPFPDQVTATGFVYNCPNQLSEYGQHRFLWQLWPQQHWLLWWVLGLLVSG